MTALNRDAQEHLARAYDALDCPTLAWRVRQAKTLIEFPVAEQAAHLAMLTFAVERKVPNPRERPLTSWLVARMLAEFLKAVPGLDPAKYNEAVDAIDKIATEEAQT